MNTDSIRLTTYSHGAGCGCKISPRVLDEILKGNWEKPDHDRLIVGNDEKDDAAVYDLGGGNGLISTTDFFMPIVDDPFDFGRIASANAISDVYAMGGRPVLALAILGWPVDKIPGEVAGRVIAGARSLCAEAGVMIGGGHSIDSPEPIFGLAVNGLVRLDRLKRNSTARPGDLLFLTKPLGIGILTTAEKKGMLRTSDAGIAARVMLRLNRIGEELSEIEGVHAMTDVTGFGLLGHLSGMCSASGTSAVIYSDRVRRITDLDYYLEKGCVPGGTKRNFDSYGSGISAMQESVKNVLCDPQTSGGILVSVNPDSADQVRALFSKNDLTEFKEPVGEIISQGAELIRVQ